MKKSILIGALLLAACGTPEPQKRGVGFDRPSAGAVPTAQHSSPAVARAVGPPEPLPASGPLPASIANVRPRIIERMQNDAPIPVYATTASLSETDLRTLSPATMAAIDYAPRLTNPERRNRGHERGAFSAGLLGGSVIRVRVNGVDFAQMRSGGFVPSMKDEMFELIAYRSGCAWNGLGEFREMMKDPYGFHRVDMWYLGLTC